jgi:alpha,alpha-trehalose-phosphate synthase [UDP-forming]
MIDVTDVATVNVNQGPGQEGAGQPERGRPRFDLVVVANRLPVDLVLADDGSEHWRPSPGGLVTALRPVMQHTDGAWVGWSGSSGEGPAPFDFEGMHLVGVPLSEQEVEEYYEGFCNTTLWPLYHDVIAPPVFHRQWWNTYVRVNERFAAAAAAQAARGGTVWVHDYQLQLVPAMIRSTRPDLKIGFFNHIPFPGYELFAQLPWRRQVVEGLLGARLVGFQRPADATNFLRACRRAAGHPTRGSLVWPDRPGISHNTAYLPGGRAVRVSAFPISIDYEGYTELARRPEVQARARQIRAELGPPRTVLLGVDRLDYTKGILNRLHAYEELLDGGLLGGPPDCVLVQVAAPSRERVDQYRAIREELEKTVGRINGRHATLGHSAVRYLNRAFPKEEMAALYLATDVMLVTALRDGMNLVAKEYVACRNDEAGALVLSEFTGAAIELDSAFLVNPHDIESLKETILRAVAVPPLDSRRRMRAMRRRVSQNDVAHWAASFLRSLEAASAATAGSVDAEQPG